MEIVLLVFFVLILLASMTGLTADSRDSADWKKENERVGKEQGVLEQRTGEVIQKLIQNGLPAEIVNLISQAQPLMADAVTKIQAAANQPALAPQGAAR